LIKFCVLENGKKKMSIRKFALGLVAAVALFGNAVQSNADYYFEITNITIAPGAGIGPEPIAESGAGGGVMLGVEHTQLTDAANSVIPPTWVVPVMSYNFNSLETFITAGESSLAKNYDFVVTIDFTYPVVTQVVTTLHGHVTAGSVKDTAGVDTTVTDYTLTFDPIAPIAFGPGGSGAFTITLSQTNPLGLTNISNSSTVNASIAITTAPVPEPTSMALLGLGAIGAAFGRYRRRSSAAV
jgi:hypothetical protein